MARRRASKARSGAPPLRTPPVRPKAKAVKTPSAHNRVAALERERDMLKDELQRAQARVRQLEEGQAQVRDRIAWALDSLHGILEGKV